MTREPRPLKFWHQPVTELGGQAAYRQYLPEHAKQILNDAAGVHARGLNTGSYQGHAPSKVLENNSIYESYDRVVEQVINNAVAILQKIACPTLNLWRPAPKKA